MNENPSNTQVYGTMCKVLQNGGLAEFENLNPFFCQQVKALKAENISVGTNAKFTTGYFEGNLRTDGYKFGGDVKYTRTINFDFTTREITFLSEDCKADSRTAAQAAKSLGLKAYAQGDACFTNLDLVGSEYYKAADAGKALRRNLRGLCASEHQKLGYKFDGLTVLQSQFVSNGETEINLFPVYANLQDKKGKSYYTLLGWYSNPDGQNGEAEFKLDNVRESQVYGKTRIVTPAEKRKKAVVATLSVIGAAAVIGGFAFYLMLITGLI